MPPAEYIINGTMKSYSVIPENDLLQQIYPFVNNVAELLYWRHTVLDKIMCPNDPGYSSDVYLRILMKVN